MKTIKLLVAAGAALLFGLVAEATITVTPTELNWTQGIAVSQALTATSDDASLSGVSASWSIDSSSLPSDVIFDTATGSFSGTPKDEGTFSIIVSVNMSTVVTGRDRTRTTIQDSGTGRITITVAKAESREETKTPSYMRQFPNSETYTMTEKVGETFSVSEADPPTGVAYSWYVSNADGSAYTKIDAGRLSCTYTPETAGNYTLVFIAYVGSDPMASSSDGGGSTSEGGSTDGGSTDGGDSGSTSFSPAYVQWTIVVESAAITPPTFSSTIAPGSYEWNQNETQAITINTESNPDCAEITYEWRFNGDYVWGGSTYTFMVSENGVIDAYVTDGKGNAYTNYTWSITAKAVAPSYSMERSDPKDATYTMTAEETKEFSVTVTGFDSCMWYLNGSFTGTTGTSFSFNPIEAGTYTVMCMGYVGGSPKAGLDWQVVVNAKSEEGGTEGGETETKTPTIRSTSPEATSIMDCSTGSQIGGTGSSISISVGSKTNLTVTLEKESSSIGYIWIDPNTGSTLGAGSTYEYTHGAESSGITCAIANEGTYLYYVSWAFTTASDGGDGKDEGEEEGGETTTPGIVINPFPLPQGKVGVAYEGATFSFSGGVSGYFELPGFVSSSQTNSFSDRSGERVTFSSDDGMGMSTATKKLPFKFPCNGAEFEDFTIYGSQIGLNSGTGVPSFSVCVDGYLDFGTDGDNGLYYSADSTTATFRWKANMISYGWDETTCQSYCNTNKINLAITLCSDGRVVYSFGDCDGLILPMLGISCQTSYDASGYKNFQYSGTGGKGSDGRSSGGEVLTSESQDLVVKENAPPPGLELSYGEAFTFGGTPTQAGTYGFTVKGTYYDEATYQEGVITTNLTLAIKDAGSMSRVSPATETLTVAENETANFEVAATGIDTADLVWSWTMSSGDTPAVTATANGATYSFASPVAGTYTITCAASGGTPSISWTLTVSHDYSKSYIVDLTKTNVQQRFSAAAGAFEKSPTYVGGSAKSVVATKCPSGVTVAADGMISGEMTDDLDGETIELAITDSDDNVINITLVFSKRSDAQRYNASPYFASATPAADAVECNLGFWEWYTFSAEAIDEEGDTLTYSWYLDGEEQTASPDGKSCNFNDNDSAHEGAVRILSCYADDGTNGKTLIKSWQITIVDPAFSFKTTSIPDGVVGGSAFLDGPDDEDGFRFHFPYGTELRSIEKISGVVPPGMVVMCDTSCAPVYGIYRNGGNYTFTLRATCSSGATAEKTFTVKVTGTRSAAQTWYIDPNNTIAKSGKSVSGTVMTDLTEALCGGLASGDTVYLYPTTTFTSSKGLALLKNIDDVTVIVTNGAHQVSVDAQYVPDVSKFAYGPGSRLVFQPSWEGYNSWIAFNGITLDYGSFLPLAYVGKDKQASAYTVTGCAKPYYYDVGSIDENGYLGFRVGVQTVSSGRDKINFADDIKRRTAILDNTALEAFYGTSVSSSKSALDATLIITNNVTVKNLTVKDGVKMIVKAGAVLTMIGELNVAEGGGIEFEAGSTFAFYGDIGLKICNRSMTLPDEGKVTLKVLSSMAQYTEFAVASRYEGPNDPYEKFTLDVPEDGQTYRLYLGSENVIMLSTKAPNSDGDPGNLNWDADPANLNDSANVGTVKAYEPFSYTFGVTGSSAESSGSTDDGTTGRSSDGTGSSTIYTYDFQNNPAYSVTRQETNTFDAAAGVPIAAGERRQEWGNGIVAIDFGFAFPAKGNYYSSLQIGADGRMWIGNYNIGAQFLEKGILPELNSSYDQLYIIREAKSLGVRFGSFGTVTYYDDGKIRFAFGPDADLRSSDNETPICRVNSVEYAPRTGSYADSGDALYTPTGSMDDGFTFNGATMSGTLGKAGVYTFQVKVIDSALKTINKTFTLTVDENPDAFTMPSVVSANGPTPEADGYIHLQPNASANFEATVSEGASMRWTVDGIVQTTASQFELTAPSERPLDAADAVVHVVAVEANDANEHADWAVRKVWYVIYNQSIPFTPGTFDSSLLAYVMDGDEIVFAQGTYEQPLDFGDNMAKVKVRGSENPYDTVFENSEENTRCFRQVAPSVVVGKTRPYEVIAMPCRNAEVSGITFFGGDIENDTFASKYAYNEGASTNYYGIVGGGAFGGSFSNCVFSGCASIGYGGGAYGAKMTHCIVEDCSSAIGGGCANCELDYCTIVYNAASSKAGGVDGQCSATKCIILGNAAAGGANDYASTTTPVHLDPYDPELTDCFFTGSGDPMFCIDYHLAEGSPATGKGAYPTPDATQCYVTVETVGAGEVSADGLAGGGVIVARGGSVVFATSGRNVRGITVNGEPIDATNTYELKNVTANTTIVFTFEPGTLTVGEGQQYSSITAAIEVAGTGDIIKVYPGTYEPVDVRNFNGQLTIEAADVNDKPVISGGNANRCVLAKPNCGDVLFRNIVMLDGYADYQSWVVIYHNSIDQHTDAELVQYYGVGGGVYGGAYEDCVISNCTAKGGIGGGAFKAILTRCTLANNVAGAANDSYLSGAWGGGSFGGSLLDCRVTGNVLRLGNPSWYVHCDGAGTYEGIVRNSYVWGNTIEVGTDYLSVETSNTATGDSGLVIQSSERVPTTKRLDERKTPVAFDGETYASKPEAEAAAAKQTVEIPTEVARVTPDQDAYVGMFEMKTVDQGDGSYVNKPVLKDEVKEEIFETELATALTQDDNGNDRTEFNVQRMDRTLTETTPGLYYALEFATDLGKANFNGERHLSNGGSVKLSATSIDSPSGFWRVNVYATPDGD